ncbi:ferric reductase-like transmembrane domain-containing protein, partial [Streptomyces sp. 2MCAF27]
MRRIRPRRSPAVPLILLSWAGAAAVVTLWWQNTPNVVGNAEWLVGGGRLTGLLSGYSIALVVLLMARVPALERRVGSDRVARWHAMSGRYTLCLILAHIVLIIWGYSAQAQTSLVDQTVTVVTEYPDMIKAVVGTGLLLLIGLISAGVVRRRMSYEA